MTILDTNNEYILCSAIKYDEIIIAGRRHGDCYKTLEQLFSTFKQGQKMYDIMLPQRNEQGFITSKDRYVDRKEAWTIALNAGQVKDRTWSGIEYCQGLPANHPNDPMILTSEDLY